MRFESRFDLVPLGSLARFINGDRGENYPKPTDYVTEGIPFLSATDVGEGKIAWAAAKKISPASHSKLRNGHVKRGDILFCLRGSLGKFGYVESDSKGAIASSLVILRANNESLARYLRFFLGSAEAQNAIKSLDNGSVQGNISAAALKGLLVPNPPEHLRAFITANLESVDGRISLNCRINQTLEAMAQALFKSWFVDFDPVKAKIAAIQAGRDPLRAAMSAISGKSDAELGALPLEQYDPLAATAALFPDEMEELVSGESPKGWSHKALAQLTDKIGSGSTPRGGKEVYLDEGVALIRSQNVYDSLFVWEGLARRSDEAATQLKGVTVQENDVLLNITGASILRTCVVEPAALPARVNQHVAIIRAKAGVPPRFIHMHLLRPEIKNYLLGLNAGASREAITKAHIESLILLTPGPELLAAFRTATDPLFRQVQRFAQQMRVLGELRDTLLPKLLSGELSVEALAESAGAA
jgi:type I restriction enzyme S subunit